MVFGCLDGDGKSGVCAIGVTIVVESYEQRISVS